MGHLNATIDINGERHTVKMPSFRDHSYGKQIFSYYSHHSISVLLLHI